MKPNSNISAVVIGAGLLAHYGVVLTCSPAYAGDSAIQMSTGWTFEKIVAAIQWRESKMAECTLKFDETVYEVDGEGGRQFDQRTVGTMYRHDNATRCSVRITHGGEAAVLNGDVEQLWDGKSCRAYVPKSQGKQYGSASIIANVPPVLDNTNLLQLIGFSEQGGMALSVHIQKLATERLAQPIISATTVDGQPVVKLRLDRPKKGGPDSEEFWFLPDKDFMPLRYQTEGWPSDEYAGPPVYVRTIAAEGIQQLGMWMPRGFSSDLWSWRGKGPHGLMYHCEGKLVDFVPESPEPSNWR